jgi:3D-(3,5/4)-trihydroxycyclohexane-1,2-dione acylhydrolase (decyclizing)
MAQALVRYLAALKAQTPDGVAPLFAGVFAIFGHGNVAGMGEALYRHRADLPTYRAHNEQAMAHAAIAYAKLSAADDGVRRRSAPAPPISSAAALAHVNRLPVLLLPGDVFIVARAILCCSRSKFQDTTITANDCLRPCRAFPIVSCIPRSCWQRCPRRFTCSPIRRCAVR